MSADRDCVPSAQTVAALMWEEGNRELAERIEAAIRTYRCEACGISARDPGIALVEGDDSVKLVLYCPFCNPGKVRPRTTR